MRSTRFSAGGAPFPSLIAIFVLGLILVQGTGCGQRGPLYLPEAEPAADSSAQADDTSTETDPTDNEDKE
jgi:predicted small lipoprotein YifL